MNFSSVITDVTFTHFHLFCGLGAGARGFNKGTARVGNLRAKFRCIGGVDNNPAAIADFGRLAGVTGTVLDMFDLDQYRAFHGRDPEPGWRPATPEDLRRSAGWEFPDMVFLSAPCKGFSGLLPEQSSSTAKYQALNRLTLRGVWLMLEAFKDSLPKLIIFENVPRIMTRGRALLDQIVALLRAYGYAVAETTHDCGEIGGLGQSRKRFLLVARHEASVPPFLYEPEKRRLRGVGEVLETLPLPGDPRGGPLHRIPALQWKTWVRLAFVEAGSDWRSLNKLAVADGMLRDFGILPVGPWRDQTLGVVPWDKPAGVVTGCAEATTGRFSIADPRAFSKREGTGFLGVTGWDEHSGTVTANGRPGAGAFSVADPRPPDGSPEYSQYGVRPWDEPSGAVINVKSPGQGVFSVADPRRVPWDVVRVDGHEKSVQLGVRKWDQTAACVKGDVSVGTGPYAVSDPRRIAGDVARIEGRPRFNNVYRIVRWDQPSPAVAGPGGPAGGLAVADPRPAPRDDYKQTKYRVTSMAEPSGTVIAASTTGNGAFAVADPRVGDTGDSYKNSYDVAGWQEPSKTVTPGHSPSNGGHSVADPRPLQALRNGVHGVRAWDEPSGTVAGESLPPNGAFSVADPRTQWDESSAHGNKMAVGAWEDPAGTVTGTRFGSGAGAIADPRPGYGQGTHQNILSVAEWEDHSKTVTGSDHVTGGALSVADPRPVGLNENREHYKTGGHYGVLPWNEHAGAVPAYGKYDRGPWSVADPRGGEGTPTETLPAPADRLVAVIRALDGTWHRPFTTLELAALQSMVDPDELENGFFLEGESDSAWRERIGNAVPPDAATAIAGVMGTTLLLAMTGETFMLSSQPIWVRPVAMALAIDQRGNVPVETGLEFGAAE